MKYLSKIQNKVVAQQAEIAATQDLVSLVPFDFDPYLLVWFPNRKMFTVLYDVEDVRDMRAWYKQYVEHNMVLDLMVSERNGTQIVPREPSDFQYCAPIYMELGTDYNYYNVEIKWYASIGDYLLKVVCRLPRALQINLVYIEARWRRDFWYELKTPGIATPNVIRYSIAKKHQVHHHLLWWPDGYAWEDIFIEE